ncbi:MAG: trypsin-like peptidase domain-containing protein, partial [Chthonomonadales bacterium]
MREIKALLVGLAMAALPVCGAAQGEPGQYQAVLAKRSPTVVTVKAVLRIEERAGGDNVEEPVMVHGAIVTPGGLVILSNTAFSPGRLLEIFGGGEEASKQIKMRPTSFKVILPGDDTEYDAFLAATDSQLELAFIQIEGLGARQLPAVDFGTSVEAVVGQPVIAVQRMSKDYDYAAYCRTGRISGEIAKPRRAWIVEGSLGELGLPVYTFAGDAVGVLTMLPTGSKSTARELSFGIFMRMMAGSGAMEGTFLVPGSAVKSVVDLAAKRASELAAERAKQKSA